MDPSWIGSIERALSRPMWRRAGRVRETVGAVLRVSGLRLPVGELCAIRRADGTESLAETVAFRSDHLSVVPFDDVRDVEPGAEVLALGHGHRVAVGDFLVGRVLDGFGRPIDGLPVPTDPRWVPVDRAAPSPLERPVIRDVMPVGVRSVDVLNTLGVGQRIGLFSVAGGGKTTLLKMTARHADCDVAVMCIVGERGRELNEFLEEITDSTAGQRLVCVATTSDRPAFERARAAFTATAIAEHFRDRGARVLLLVDSVTRFARAQRELGVSIGEPVTRRGYTVSVFSELARLMERAGPARHGSITAIYTVLVEDEQTADPVAEEVRSIVDGHLVLSRKLVERGQFPAIDVLASLSRLMPRLVDSDHRALAEAVRALLAKFDEIEMLHQIGEYQAGSDPMADQAIAVVDALRALLAQHEDESEPMDRMLERFRDVLRGAGVDAGARIATGGAR
ncbi:MAG: type secretion system ATPase [Pseudomonadota bacterium]|jgi:type III secretion protein N (ATPase)